jgi:PAS domain S-box-containing protein/putative nucleotidyltransferase with HDIG domain
MRDREAINILLIEDDPNDVFLLKRALAETSTFSFHFSQADCLRAGLDILVKGEIDVVLLDLNLPDSRGLDTLKTLRHHTTQVPVVVMSGLLDDELAVKAIRLGAQELLLEKRTDGQTITRIINCAIERHRLHHDLEISEGHVRSIIANNLDGILIVDAEGLVHFMNHAAELIFGRSAAQLVGETFGFPVSVGVSELEIWRRNAPSLFVEMQSAAIDWDGKPAYLTSLRNITDRKLAEQARWEAEHKLNKMLQSMVDGTVVVDLSGIITYANPAAERIFEIHNDTIIGIYYFSREWIRVDADRKSYPLDQLPLAIALREQREVNAIENGIITPSGEIKWLSVNASPLVDEKGKLYGAIASFRDITEQKKVAEALGESQKQIALQASLLDQARNAVVAIDLDGKIFYWNKFSETLYQWKREEVIGKPISEVIVPKEDIVLAEETFKSLQNNGYWEGEFIVSRKDGSLFPVQVVDTVIRDDEGRAIGYIGVSIDITERKWAEETMRRSRDLLEITGQIANIGGWELNLETQVLNWTEEVYRIHEVDPATQIDVAEAINFYAPEARPVISAAVQAGIDSGTAWDLELPLITAQGRHIWVRAQGAAERRGSKTVRLNGAFQDITERKLAEEEIRSRTQGLELLYNLSHILADASDIDQVFDTINRYVVENVQTTFSRIALIENNDLVIKAAYPLRTLGYDLLVGDRKAISDLIYFQRILESKEPVILKASDPEIEGAERATLLLDYVSTLCLFPLRVGDFGRYTGQALGLLMLGEERNEGREPISVKKLNLIRNIGDQAASAIRRMLLKGETQRRMEQLSALNEIDKAIASGFDLNTNLRTCLAQVINQLMVDAADILLFNSSQQTLEYFCGEGFRTKAIEGTRLRLGESFAGRAALERVMVHVSNLQDPGNFLVTPNLADENFVSYFGVPLIAKGKIRGVLEIFHRTPLKPVDEWLEFFNALAGQTAIAVDNAMLFDGLNHSTIELTQAYDETIEGWSRALDLRDKETEGHSLRVTNNALKLARSLGLNKDELEQLRWGALLHDIGKMGVPDGILLKPGPLTDEEWVLMRKHPTLAYELLSPIHYLRLALDIPYCHHEKWDGTGYPRGLKGEHIPLAARIFAIADVWDALRSDRPYRLAWPEEKVLALIQSLAGNHLDPRVVETFLRIRDEITD